MRASSVAVPLVALLMVLSGCSADDTTTKESAPSAPASPAAAPSVDADVGSVAGTVVDAELQPVAGADVALLENQMATKSDANGSFTLNGVAPGSYRVVAEALGYESTARKVEVAAGEVTKLQLVLVAVTLDSESYYVPTHKTAFITLDQQWFSYVVNVLGHVNHSQVCGQCIFTIRFPSQPSQIVTEPMWPQWTAPGWNDASALWFNWTAPSPNFHNNFYCSHQKRNWTATLVESVAKSKVTAMMVTVQSGYFAVSFQHRIDLWDTFSYGGMLADDYTALPPGPPPSGVSTCDL